MTISPLQSRLARTALNLPVRDAAQQAGMSPNTVTRFERGEPLLSRTLAALESVYVAGGVEFIEGGVRLRAAR